MSRKKVNPQHYCVDCGKPVSKLRCSSCHMKHRWENPKYRQQQVEAISIASKMNWKDSEYREHTSLAFKLQWKDNEHRRNNASIKAKELWNNPDHKKLMSDHMKKQMHKLYADPDYLDRMRERSINQWKDPNGKSRKKLYTYLHKFKPSSLEMQFKQYLDDANILYKQQYKPKGCHRVYDFMLIDYNALIEIDGMFWHYSKWAINHGKPDNDAYKEKYAIEHGFDFVRIPECDLTQAIVTDWLLPELLKVGDNDS